MRPLSFFLFACATLAACGGSSADGAATTSATTSGDASTNADAGAEGDADPGFVPAAHPALPQIPNLGGPIVKSPDVVTLTWSSDPIAADLEAFDDWIMKSAFWKEMMAEWGVGPGLHGASYRIPSAAPATLDEAGVQKVIEDAIAAGKIPPPSADRIYSVYPPAGTAVTNAGVPGCTGFQAYHFSFARTGAPAGEPRAIYAITPQCAERQGMTMLDWVTWGSSHELMEAASDPIYDAPAWVIREPSVATPELGENADLCSGNPTKVEGHQVTRNWSNVAAAKGDRPCVPAPPGPGFGVYADPPEITIAPGKTATVKVRAWSSAPMDAFRVVPYPMTPSLTAKLSAATASNGDELTLTVTAGSDWVEPYGANLVSLYVVLPDYSGRTSLVVHAP